LGTHRIAKRLDKLQDTVRLLAAQIQDEEDSSTIVKTAAALARSANQVHADLVRDCLSQALVSPNESAADTARILQHLTKMLR
jgi:DNA-binding FrmR family transcriptional regulator